MTTLAIAGNPNCGKSALFNNLTGIRQTTGNWPGVTVERKQGSFNLAPDNKVTVIDLPGIYTLDAMSLDEQVTRDYLLSREADVVLNVLDAANLERNLYLTVQLLEMGVPVVLALNMMDIAQKRGISIDVDLLAKKLGCPVVRIVAVSGKGIDDLKQAALDVIKDNSRGGFSLTMDAVIETALADIRPQLPVESHVYNTYWIALKLLEGDASVCTKSPSDELSQLIQKWQQGSV